jgi:hypothetical protein
MPYSRYIVYTLNWELSFGSKTTESGLRLNSLAIDNRDGYTCGHTDEARHHNLILGKNIGALRQYFFDEQQRGFPIVVKGR